MVQALDEKRAAVTGYNSRGTVTKSRRQAPACPVAVQQRAQHNQRTGAADIIRGAVFVAISAKY